MTPLHTLLSHTHRRFLAGGVLSLLTLLGLLFMGCGGGGGSSSNAGATFPIPISALTASGRVVLPTGFKGSPAAFRVVTGLDDEAVKADGTFGVRSPGAAQSLTILEDGNGKVVLFGFVDGSPAGVSPQSGGLGEISAKQTAVALLFYTLGLNTLPATAWQQALAMVAASPQCASLASVIETEVANNPTALNDGDPQIASAVTAARQSILPGSRSVSPGSSSRLAAVSSAQAQAAGCGPLSATVTVTRAATGPGFTIEPAGERSGLEVLQSSDGAGVVVVNHFRRRAAAFVYEIATVDDQGNRTDLPTPKEMSFSKVSLLTAIQNAGSLTAPSNFLEIGAANTLNGTFGALSDVLPSYTAPAGSPVTNGAWVQSTSDTIPLSPDGTAARTIFKVIVVGPSFAQKNDVTTSLLATDQAFHLTAFAPEWQSVVTTLSREEYILDIALPLVTSVVLSGEFEKKLEALRSTGVTGKGNLKNDVAIFTDFVAFIGGVPDIDTSVRNGDLAGAMKALVQTLVDSGESRDRLTNILLKQVTINYPPNVFGPPKDLATEFKGALEKFAKAVSVVDLLLAIADTSKLIHDSIAALPVLDWDVTVTKIKVVLNPATATVDATTTIVTLAASPGTDATKPFLYHYTCTGRAGGIEDTTHTSGRDESFDSSDAQIEYAEGASATDGQTDAVTVQVFKNSGTPSKPLKGDLVGSASSTITVNLGGGNCNGPAGTPIASVCGELTVPALVKPGDQMTVGVTLHTGGACGNGATLSLNAVGVSAVTLDGVPQANSTVAIPGTAKGSGASTHTVVYTIASDAKDCIGTSKANANQNLIIPQIFGPWVVLQEGSGGNNSGWTSQQPFQVKK